MKDNKVFFKCAISCAEVCCTGATLLTHIDIPHVYKIFPITIGFWKYKPITQFDEDFFREIGLSISDFFVIGEFIGGNWREKRCKALGKDKRCILHLDGVKPLQCRLIPFSAIFEESIQDKVIDYQRSKSFKRCQGFNLDNHLTWENGVLVDTQLKKEFHEYRNLLKLQKPLMMSIIKELKKSSSYKAFLHGKHGILEVPILKTVFEDFIQLTGLGTENKSDYLNHQMKLLNEVERTEKGDVFSDALAVYNSIL